jgi:hypothetical protein
MPATGPEFVSLQVRDLESSAPFYEQYLGLVRNPAGPPRAVLFATKSVAFTVRDLLFGVDLSAITQPGEGIAVWLRAPEAQQIHDALAPDGGHDRYRALRRAVRADLHIRRPRLIPDNPAHQGLKARVPTRRAADQQVCPGQPRRNAFHGSGALPPLPDPARWTSPTVQQRATLQQLALPAKTPLPPRVHLAGRACSRTCVR